MSQAFEAQKPVDQVVKGKNEGADIWPEVDCAGFNLGAEGQYKISEDEDAGVSLGAESQFNDKRLDDRGAGVSLGAESQFNDKRPDDRGAGVSLGARGQFTNNRPDDEVVVVSLGVENDEGAGVEKAINDELVQDEGEVETSVDNGLVEDEGEVVDDDNVYLVRVRYQVDGEGDKELEAAREKLGQSKKAKKSRENNVNENVLRQDDVHNTQNLGNNRAATEGLNENEEGYDIEDDEFHNWTYVGFDVEPINGRHEWKKSELEPIQPPVESKMPGRPKKARRKSKGKPRTKAGHISRVGNINTCSLCNKQGHNKCSCPDRGSTSTKVRPLC
ncbi:hypothetical protein PTKIN_Ptkin14bG0200900 [Pterospermum kingtungense]